MKNIEYGTEFLDQLKDSVHDLYDENKKLKDRISKAIEFIKQKEIYVFYQELGLQQMNAKKELLEILEGSGKDE